MSGSGLTVNLTQTLSSKPYYVTESPKMNEQDTCKTDSARVALQQA